MGRLQLSNSSREHLENKIYSLKQQGFSFGDISKQLEIPKSTVQMYYRRAYARLKPIELPNPSFMSRFISLVFGK